jgi:hypothetical protein
MAATRIVANAYPLGVSWWKQTAPELNCWRTNEQSTPSRASVACWEDRRQAWLYIAATANFTRAPKLGAYAGLTGYHDRLQAEAILG